MIYLNQLGIVKIDVETEEAAPWYAIIIFAFIGTGLIYYYKNFLDQKKNRPADGQ